MKEVFGPVTGFKILEGPPDAPKRLDLRIDINGIEQHTLKGVRWEKTLHPFNLVRATAENGNLILILSDERYVLQTKKPDRYAEKIEEIKATTLVVKKQKGKANFSKGTGMHCIVCGREQANATCKQCGGKACPSHYNHINDATYCHRCLVLCPQCKSIQLSAHKGGFSTGAAVAGWLVGGVILGGFLGTLKMNDIELFCHSCGHKWKPRI